MTALGHGYSFDIVPIWTVWVNFCLGSFSADNSSAHISPSVLGKMLNRCLFHCLSADSQHALPMLALWCRIVTFLIWLAFPGSNLVDPLVW